MCRGVRAQSQKNLIFFYMEYNVDNMFLVMWVCQIGFSWGPAADLVSKGEAIQRQLSDWICLGQLRPLTHRGR